MSALDALAADDLVELPAGSLLELVRELVAAQNRIAAQLARAVRRADVCEAAEADGIASMASWLRGHCRLSAAEASRVVRRGRALASLPAVAAGFADGAITAEQVS